MSSQYAPQGVNLRMERSILAGALLAMFGYGIFLSVTSMTVYMMIINTYAGRPPSRLVVIYTFLLFAGGTVFSATNWQWAQVLFIDQRDYPGGPGEAFFMLFNNAANVISNIALILNTLLVESLLLWRLYIIWEHKFWVMVVPTLWLLATLGLAAMSLVLSSQPGVDPRKAIDFAVPYFICSVLLNLALTILIASRLLYLRRHLAGTAQTSSSAYFSLASLLIESSVLQSGAGLATCVGFAVDNASSAFLIILLGEMVCISPMLIILRVAWGTGFTHTRSMQLQTSHTHTHSAVNPYASSTWEERRTGTMSPSHTLRPQPSVINFSLPRNKTFTSSSSPTTTRTGTTVAEEWDLAIRRGEAKSFYPPV